MSLMQLLTVGHSFVGIKDAPSRYKLTENWLPRFGPLGSVPVAQACVAAPALPVAPTVSKPRSWLQSAPAVEAVPRNAAEPAVSRGPDPAPPQPEPARAAAVSRPPRAALKKARAAFPHPELSLDRVKVVRNDLSDADLEIIPAANPPSAGGGGEPQRLPAPVAARPAAVFGWGRLAVRLFNVGRGLFLM